MNAERITLCKFQGGVGGARSADSRPISLILLIRNRTKPAPKTCTEPLAVRQKTVRPSGMLKIEQII
jgi:hypothetical protein